ncbi:hypothetical protein BDC45DRAFT_583889 [Circinella umbellata]|nr:hypothetical protein BDC45DRAFT_583889 [Circinella umbellata]
MSPVILLSIYIKKLTAPEISVSYIIMSHANKQLKRFLCNIIVHVDQSSWSYACKQHKTVSFRLISGDLEDFADFCRALMIIKHIYLHRATNVRINDEFQRQYIALLVVNTVVSSMVGFLRPGSERNYLQAFPFSKYSNTEQSVSMNHYKIATVTIYPDTLSVYLTSFILKVGKNICLTLLYNSILFFFLKIRGQIILHFASAVIFNFALFIVLIYKDFREVENNQVQT